MISFRLHNNSIGDDIIKKYEPSLGKPKINNRLVLFWHNRPHVHRQKIKR